MSSPSGFIEMWARTIDEGLVPRVIITSNRHQMGKTACAIRIMEKVQEQIHGRKFDIDDLTLTCLEFMRRRKMVPEWTPLTLDEPERPVGNKSSWDYEAMLFVEDLMTSPFHHIPAMFALPHGHFLNLSIYGVCTSQIVKMSKKECRFYRLERDQLNRRLDTYTFGQGHFSIEMPYAWDWEAYCKKRNDFDTERGKMLEEKIASLHAEGKLLDKEGVYLLVKADPKRFTDPVKGKVTQAEIETKLGCSQAAANYAANKFNRMERSLEIAEAGRISSGS